jgi:pyruvate dehydrogenase E1 component beta subunit
MVSSFVNMPSITPYFGHWQVINLRSIRPLDRASINASVRKTNRLVTVEEAFPQHGVGAEIWFSLFPLSFYLSTSLSLCGILTHVLCSMSVVEECFEYLDAPVERIAGADVPMPYAANIERMAVPQVTSFYLSSYFFPESFIR